MVKFDIFFFSQFSDFTPRALRYEIGVYEISVRSMNIDDRQTTDRPTSGPFHTFFKNFKWP